MPLVQQVRKLRGSAKVEVDVEQLTQVAELIVTVQPGTGQAVILDDAHDTPNLARKQAKAYADALEAEYDIYARTHVLAPNGLDKEGKQKPPFHGGVSINRKRSKQGSE